MTTTPQDLIALEKTIRKLEREAIELIVTKFMCETCRETGVYEHDICEDINRILSLIDDRNYKEKEEK
jgi:hypothetical protein